MCCAVGAPPLRPMEAPFPSHSTTSSSWHKLCVCSRRRRLVLLSYTVHARNQSRKVLVERICSSPVPVNRPPMPHQNLLRNRRPDATKNGTFQYRCQDGLA